MWPAKLDCFVVSLLAMTKMVRANAHAIVMRGSTRAASPWRGQARSQAGEPIPFFERPSRDDVSAFILVPGAMQRVSVASLNRDRRERDVRGDMIQRLYP
jgi:hypothetical protein